jgi:hypothetical protein
MAQIIVSGGSSGRRAGLIPVLFLVLFLTGFSAVLFAFDSQPDFLSAELWVELVPPVAESALEDAGRGTVRPFEEILPMTARPLEHDEAVRRLLEEARFVVSGMIYGFRLEYTPMDRERGVEELFSAEPVAVIPWGDPGLRVMDTWQRNGMLFARVRYDLSEAQRLRLKAWSSAVHESAGASASAPLSMGYRGRMEAHRLAIKAAFREYLRGVERNKPRASAARAVLSAAPVSAVSAGGYRSTVRIRLDVGEIQSYGAY